jgi:hypothetical protein
MQTPKKKNFAGTPLLALESLKMAWADLNLPGKYISMLEIWKHYD